MLTLLNLLLPVLRTHWKVLAAALAAALVLSAGGQGWHLYQRHRLRQQVEATARAQAAHAAGEARAERRADSVANRLRGRLDGLDEAQTLLKTQDEALSHRPRLPALPADPPRQ